MTPTRFSAVEFTSAGVTLRGRLYLPGARPAASVVVAHGFSATIPMVLDRYAEVFQDAGLAALAFDQPGLGTSDGEPRGEINPWVSVRAFRSAVDLAVSLVDIDANRIALWGDSMSARVAFVASALDERVRGLVCQVPAMGARVPSAASVSTSFGEIAAAVRAGRVRGPAETWGSLPVVSPDQVSNPSALIPLTAFRWFIEHGGRYGSGWHNRVQFTAARDLPAFDPFACAEQVRVPTQFVMSPADEMPGANSKVARALFDLLPGRTELVEVDGGHFGLLEYPSAEFLQASAAESAFLARVLGAA